MGDYESSPSYNSSSSLSKKLFLGSGDASEFNIKPLTLIDPSLYDGEVKRRQRKVVVHDVDVTPLDLVDTGNYFYTDLKYRPKASIWTKGVYKFADLEGILGINKEEVKEEEERLTMEELTTQVVATNEGEEEVDSSIPGISLLKQSSQIRPESDLNAIYIKILITETEDITFYESPSLTVLKEDVEEEKPIDNKSEVTEVSESLSEVRKRFSDAEAQTQTILHKTKGANTDRIKKIEQSSFVSNYDMFDTYAELETSTKELSIGNDAVEITTFTKDGIQNPDEILVGNAAFRKSSMVIERLLAANIFGNRQKRFRSFRFPDPYDKTIRYLYRLDQLWTYKNPELIGKAVASFSWCPRNGDILAVAYGVYGFATHEYRNVGYVCVWNIKNPVNPERRWMYFAPVTAVAFSKSSPQLLAIGLYNGLVEIRDITLEEGAPVAKSDRKTAPGFEPIMHIEWLETTDGKEALLAASLDGTIMRYTITTGTYLSVLKQIRLDRVEGVVEGLKIAKNKAFLEADRHPQALCLKMHPVQKEVYFVGTDEGCLHRCSIFFSHQHIGVLQAHQGGIYSIEYNPWCSKIFLTCGADWKIRLWIEGIFEPILELEHSMKPYQCLVWSPIHSTIFATCTQSSVQFWDLRRKNMKPASRHEFESSTTLTTIKFSTCGRCLIVGDAEGKVMVCACEDMPFPPHYQYDELEVTMLRILAKNDLLLKQFKEIIKKEK